MPAGTGTPPPSSPLCGCHLLQDQLNPLPTPHCPPTLNWALAPPTSLEGLLQTWFPPMTSSSPPVI